MAVTETSGNGFALYNGVKLPKLPEWDKTTYPYAILLSDSSAGVPALICSTKTPEYNSSSGVRIRVSKGTVETICQYVWGGNAWGGPEIFVFDQTNSSTVSNTYSNVVWSYTDILNTSDSSVYLSASTPIPLDGMNVIEWDGEADENTVAYQAHPGLGYFVKVSDNVITLKDCADSLLVQTYGEGLLTNEFSEGDFVDSADWGGIAEAQGMGVFIATATSGTVDAVTPPPETGMYFHMHIYGEWYTQLFAYTPAAVSEPDFDLKSYEIGFLAGLVSRGQVKGSGEPVTYESLGLPALPARDEKKYPYILVLLDVPKRRDRASLYFSSTKFSRNTLFHPSSIPGLSLSYTDHRFYAETDGEYIYYSMNTGSDEWTYYGPDYRDGTSTAGKLAFDYSDIDAAWANFDVLNHDDGTVFLKAGVLS